MGTGFSDERGKQKCKSEGWSRWPEWTPDVGYADDEMRGIPRVMHASEFFVSRDR